MRGILLVGLFAGCMSHLVHLVSNSVSGGTYTGSSRGI